MQKNRYKVNCLQLSDNNKYFLSETGQEVVYLWDFNTLKIIKKFDTKLNIIKDVMFFNDDKLVFVAQYGAAIQIWDTEKGVKIADLYNFSNNDDYVIIATDGRYDGTEKGLEYLHYSQNMKFIPLDYKNDPNYCPNLLKNIIK